MVAVIAGLAVLDVWLFGLHGLSAGAREVINDPVLLLGILGLTLVSAVFHELGHATACRYGGARPGTIGFGLYLVWPSFYTDVTDTYRLGRAGRLRTDLGGIYFNAVFVLGLAGVYAATGYEALLLVIVLSHVEALEQLLPFVRFDGYFVLSDAIGVPDLFARMGPIVRATVRRRPPDPRAGLRPLTRVLVTIWVLAVIPLLAANVGVLLWHLPSIESTLLHSMYAAGARAVSAVAAGHWALATLQAVGSLLVVIPAAGALYIIGMVGRQLGAAYLRRSHRIVHHALAATILAGGLAGLVLLWASDGQLRAL